MGLVVEGGKSVASAWTCSRGLALVVSGECWVLEGGRLEGWG